MGVVIEGRDRASAGLDTQSVLRVFFVALAVDEDVQCPGHHVPEAALDHAGIAQALTAGGAIGESGHVLADLSFFLPFHGLQELHFRGSLSGVVKGCVIQSASLYTTNDTVPTTVLYRDRTRRKAIS